MRIFTKSEEISRQCDEWRNSGDTIALAPTMGYYHAGHESLIRWARNNADRAVVSLFVNPAQFGPNEDLAAYPRNFERDAKIAESLGVDALFCPESSDIYADDHATWVISPVLSAGLCGASRPVHFKGVCTIVLKLFNIIRPHAAVFGEKDWQQQAVIKRMVRDLNVPVKIVSLPAVREKDGLAMSSRNVYLSPEERAQAPKIREGLLRAREACQKGETSFAAIKKALLEFWAAEAPLGACEYAEAVDPETLEPMSTIDKASLLACAMRFGGARLIDNILLRN